MTPLEIEVTAEDIRKGRRNDCRSCPIALAIRRASGEDYVRVSPAYVLIGDTHDHADHDLPTSARNFIRHFDAHLPVAPFTFRLE